MADLTDRSVAASKEGVDMSHVALNEQEKIIDEKNKKTPKQKQSQVKKKLEDAALIGITAPKEEDFASWYGQILDKGEFLDYTDISGFFVYNPSAMAVWKTVERFLTDKFETLDVRPSYYPMLISEAQLQVEKDHLEGFEAEVAWVTHGGKEKLAKRLAIRPTSETAMYPHFAKKIRSHRDLPFKRNQWNNVIRWEFKHPVPFLRSREFLWQEGHTAHLTREGAGEEVLQILDFYAAVYEELLAVPVVKGTKTDNEKFAGADYTTTIEGFIPTVGRGIQAATSHCLGQHFSKMYGITVEDPTAKEGEKKPPLNVWQNSWGFTTRCIGIMIMVHGDNKGLVIPPRVAEYQVVIVPVGITAKTTAEAKEYLYTKVQSIKSELKSAGVRVELDMREQSPGWKFNEWELKGVPLRIEFGPKDLEKGVVTTSRRDREGKSTIVLDKIKTEIPALLETIQMDLFEKAEKEYRAHRVQVFDWKDFVPTLNEKNLCLIRFCEGDVCEDEIKELSKRKSIGDDLAEDARAPSMGAKSLCIPFDQPEGIVKGETPCTNPNCKAKAKRWCLFGRSY